MGAWIRPWPRTALQPGLWHGLIGTPANADHRALAWHAYLWDAWFLVWGLLVTAALLRSR